MNRLANLIISSLAVLLASYLLPGVQISNFFIAILVALVIAVLNVSIKPVLVVLTIPFTILSFGLFLLLINGIIVWIASLIVPGFVINGFGSALAFSIVLSLIQWSINLFSEPTQPKRHRRSF